MQLWISYRANGGKDLQFTDMLATVTIPKRRVLTAQEIDELEANPMVVLK